MRNHGTDASRRFGLMGERIDAMKAIWAEDEASYSGKYVSFDRIWSWPKPEHKPHPPVLVGGNGPRVLDRVLAFGDEWMPNRISDDDLAARIAELGARASEAGRDRIPVTVVGSGPDPVGFERLAGIGVDRIVFWLPQESPDAVEAAYGQYASAVEQFQRAG
jgi:alkanesulfonate monooxygenase SsuD/methylene tetrahydromethanopterin reductase-like flavin-dependent oxidoreductase (luciferase family)